MIFILCVFAYTAYTNRCILLDISYIYGKFVGVGTKNRAYTAYTAYTNIRSLKIALFFHKHDVYERKRGVLLIMNGNDMKKNEKYF